MKTQRDHAKLICDIGELSGLFADTTSLEAFFQKIVSMIAAHMQSDVCSIYLFYEEAQELALKATKGLNPDSIGKVKLKLGEGLTGLALKELRPICEGRASLHPRYKYFPNIGEEKYESFLAMPILRGNTRIGAMVVQNKKKNYFTEEDVKILRAITSQLANTIETAKLLMGLEERKEEKKTSVKKGDLKFIKGRVGSPGFAYQEAVVIDNKKSFAKLASVWQDVPYTLEDFYRALQATEKQLKAFQKQIEERLVDVASLIFTAQILMLKDKSFVDAIVDAIKQGANPLNAIMAVVQRYVDTFDRIANSYLREKGHDVEDVGRRLLENLVGIRDDSSDCQGRIVIAQELFPSDILKFSSQNVKGVILLSGGVSSHLAILARSLQIPLVIAEEPKLLETSPRMKVIIDGETGNIYVNPTERILAPFKEHESARLQLSRHQKTLSKITQTKDGTRVKLLSNINLLSDLKIAHELSSEGVGLYRSEFPFIVRNNFPSEEEQYVIYKKLVEGMPGKEITFRTLDIGGDKVLSYYNFEKEENPFLGMRSIRFSLRHKDIFSAQIRAILRAGVGADINIMFPMISSVDEFVEAKAVMAKCLRDLKNERIPHNEHVPLGVMIELPSVLEIIDDLAQAADFFSIGTNDFIQYMLAVDRTNEKVAELYLASHPAVLRALKKIVEAACQHKKDVSICGDMAHDEKYLSFLLGIGIRRMSLDSRFLPKIKIAVGEINLANAQEKAKLLLAKTTLHEIDEVLAKK